MDFEIVWTEPALMDLEAIVGRLAVDSPDAAETPREELLESVGILARFPYIGPVYERDRTGRAREILCRRYRVFYQVNEPQRRVEVLTIWHGSRQDPRLAN